MSNIVNILYYRVDAIRSAENERDIKSASRINPMDEQLTRQKGLLRAPSSRKDGAMKRMSAEIKEKVDEMVKQVNEANSAVTSPIAGGSKPCPETEKSNDVAKDVTNSNSNQPTVETVSKVEMSLDLDPKVNNETKGDNVGLEESMMPDIAAEAVRSERENSPQSLNCSPGGGEEDTSSFSIVTSDSEEDITLESSHSFDDSVKPGHVKDMIKKVASIAKGGEGASDEQQCRARFFSTSEDNGVEHDRVNQFVAIDKAGLGKSAESLSSEAICKSPSSKFIAIDKANLGKSAECLSPEAICKSPSSSDELYISKSFPELAQVFESGDLKTKKKSSKSDKERLSPRSEKERLSPKNEKEISEADK